MTEWNSGTDYRPRVSVHNGRAVSTRWADADQMRAAVKHAGKKDGTYVLGDGGWAPVEVSPVTPPALLAWPAPAGPEGETTT